MPPCPHTKLHSSSPSKATPGWRSGPSRRGQAGAKGQGGPADPGGLCHTSPPPTARGGPGGSELTPRPGSLLGPQSLPGPRSLEHLLVRGAVPGTTPHSAPRGMGSSPSSAGPGQPHTLRPSARAHSLPRGQPPTPDGFTRRHFPRRAGSRGGRGLPGKSTRARTQALAPPPLPTRG